MEQVERSVVIGRIAGDSLAANIGFRKSKRRLRCILGFTAAVL